MAIGKVIFLAADMCGQRGCRHSQSGSDTRDQEAVQRQYGAFTLLQLLDTADLPGITALIVPPQCYQGMKENDPAVAWHGLQRMPNHPNSGGQKKEDKYRAEHPSWMDEEVAPADIPKQWQEARANRRMQFKVGNYRDGSWESNIRLLTGTIKADWIQLPVEQYLAALPTLKQGVIAGVFRQKGAAPWGITNAEKLQLSVFLPNELSLEDWYAGVYGLPTLWPEVSMMGADHLRKVAGYDFHDLRRKYDVRTMWGDLDPQWRLLQSQLVARGPGWYSPADLKERLFTNKSKRPGDDLKEALRTDDDTLAWQAWNVAHDLIWQSCRPGPPLVFPGKKELIRAMYDQIGKEEQVISPPYTRTPLDASMRGQKKRKQGEDNALVGCDYAAWLHAARSGA